MEPYEEIANENTRRNDVSYAEDEQCSKIVARVRPILEAVVARERDLFFRVCKMQKQHPKGLTENQLFALSKKVFMGRTLRANSVWNLYLREFKDHNVMVMKGNLYYVRVQNEKQLDEILALSNKIDKRPRA